MILPFKDLFPDGEPTNFRELIMQGKKIHTLRDDENNRWDASRRIDMCYHCRQPNMEVFHRTPCTGTQKIIMRYHPTSKNSLVITVDKIQVSAYEIDLIIRNDGLTLERFIQWFFGGKTGYWQGKIIHWTGLRYGVQ